MTTESWPLKRKYRPRGRQGDYVVQQGRGRAHSGNQRRNGTYRRHKLTAEEKKRGLYGYHVQKPSTFVLRNGKVRRAA